MTRIEKCAESTRWGPGMVLALLLVWACGPARPGEAANADESPATLSPSQVAGGSMEDGFVQLLKSSNGRYHKGGWNHYGPGYFELDPTTGVLTSHGGMGLFWYSVEEFGDFVLELDFMCANETTNSGVFLRVPGVPTSDDYIYHSFEIQIDDASEGIHQTGAAYDAEPPTHLASHAPGEWNHYRITFVGARLQVELNGEMVLDWDAEPRGKVEDFAREGYVGLQNHDDQSPVSFRNIFIKPLD